MKRGTPEHGKTLHLADVLGCERAEAVGLLELLWHFTARSAPQGDVGKFSNRQIVTGLYSSRDPDAVIAALQHTGWLDPHPRHRLIVHDWAHHLDQAVHKMLQRRGLKPYGVSGRRPDTIQSQRPDGGYLPRAGAGAGAGSGSSPSGSGSFSGEEGTGEKGGRGTRLADPCPLLAEWRDEAIKLGLPEDQVESVFEEFGDYWHGVPGAKGRKTDWLGTWRNNVRRAVARLSTTPTSRNGGGRWTHPKTAGNVAAAEEFLRRHRARKENDADGS